jgi:hypothetical protein
MCWCNPSLRTPCCGKLECRPLAPLQMNFGQALEQLKAGARVSRAGWNGKGMWAALQVPDAHSKMSRPYLYLKAVDGTLGPWIPSQTDILAEDWSVVP